MAPNGTRPLARLSPACVCPNTVWTLFFGYWVHTGAKNRLYIQLGRFPIVVDVTDSLFLFPSWPPMERDHWDACCTRACVPTPSGPCLSASGLILELKTAFTSNWDGSRPFWTWGIVYFGSPHVPQRNETIGTPVARVRVPQHRLDPVCRLLGQYWS